MSDAGHGTGQREDMPPAWRNWLIAILLAACYALAYLDRQVISLLIKPIKATLGITDTQFGLLHGISFSLFYVSAAYPLAWLADRTRRSRVMAACVAGWSAMTMGSGMANSFFQLLLARIGVAIGEAGLTPAAQATLSDRFDRRSLALATSLFMLAPFVGGGLALSLGAWLYGWAQHLGSASLLIQLGLKDWQIVFLVIGAFGLIPAALLLLIVDHAQNKPHASRPRNNGEVFKLFLREWKIFILYPVAMAVVMVVLASYVTWLPAAIMRSKSISEARVGVLFGPVYTFSGVAGTLGAGFYVMWRSGDNPVRVVLRMMLMALLLLWPLSIFAFLTSSLTAQLVMMGLALFLISSVTSLSPLSFQFMTPRHLRAQAIALMAMVAALVGTGLGPVLAGVLSDRLHGVEQPLSIALALIGGIFVPIALLLLWIVLGEHERRRLDFEHAVHHS
ncbi:MULTISPECIES: MFS transporter [unclassified Novosphingobium]|uniref:MFS transporter n=1 Tax=unclassified Novosphingobium TaxID=2644732 RepID=UPI000D31312A|nr:MULTISPECIES: MFS transporter [unclassified Novosphingobium]PTR12581.1 putative MFS family arabinose efflux permease [Novosphingobium sp. GV055]PUB06365.1 putative MFS family arabinose efflux permease [Novosphingobium sp. GV061]PUB22416.1 putative MFS family arabinose efflux permease [Novosphingobium sp. GV079]PUB44441.1 putative MFS family arabinose efflux permease [Novosphingobium sp. GV027]